MSEKWLAFGHHFYPSVTINGFTFRGEVSPDNVFEAICATFEKMPKKCEDWFNKHGLEEVVEVITKKRESSGWGLSSGTVWLLVFILLGALGVMFYNFR